MFGKMLSETARQVELLADDHRHEPHVRADAHPRPAGSAAAHVRVDREPAPATASSTSRFWNRVSSIGAFILAIGMLLFLINVFHTTRKGAKAPLDPWDARSLEWMTTNPPKEHNFDAIPTVHSLDEFFHRKYEDVGDRRRPRLPAGGHRRRRSWPSRRPTPTATSTCRRRRTGRCVAGPRRCRSSAYGVIFNRMLIAVVGGAHPACSRCSAGRSSRRSPTSPTSTRRPRWWRGPSSTWPSWQTTWLTRRRSIDAARATVHHVDDHGGARSRRHVPTRTHAPGSPTTSWRMWLFLGRSACCSAA